MGEVKVFSLLGFVAMVMIFPGANSDEVTPVPIPNTAVKLVRADGSLCASVRESRSAPGYFYILLMRNVSSPYITNASN